MPEKPEVVTVSRSLETKILGKLITDCHVYWNNIIVGDIGEFERKIKNQTIESITTRGKWIVIFLSKSALLIHLRMEGKFFFRKKVRKEVSMNMLFLNFLMVGKCVFMMFGNLEK